MDYYSSILYAISAAALFGINVHIQRKALDDTNAVLGALLSVGSMALLFWIVAPLALDPAWLNSRAAVIFLGVGVFFPALGQAFQIASVSRVGPSLTAAIGAFTPFFAVIVAIYLLSELPSSSDYLGISLMTLALILVGYSKKGISRGFPLWAIVFPLGAAFSRGLGQPLSRFGLQEIPSPYFATLMAATMATVVLCLNWLAFGRGKKAGPKGIRIFLFSGFVNGLGILCVNSALRLGEIATITPLIATSPLWAILFSVVLFQHEVLHKRHYFVALLVFLGTVLILT